MIVSVEVINVRKYNSCGYDGVEITFEYLTSTGCIGSHREHFLLHSHTVVGQLYRLLHTLGQGTVDTLVGIKFSAHISDRGSWQQKMDYSTIRLYNPRAKTEQINCPEKDITAKQDPEDPHAGQRYNPYTGKWHWL